LTLIETETRRAQSTAPGAPAHETIYKVLRTQILFGEMAPGQHVTIQGLVQNLGAGMTPVREAIRRLISDGALQFQGNRRVSVLKLARSDLEQLIFLRKTIETDLTVRAAQRITQSEIVGLGRIDDALDAAIAVGDVAGYLRFNFAFHQTLYTVADAPILTELTDRLWLHFGPSLRVFCGRFGTQNLPDRHKELLAALTARDPMAAGQAMEMDVVQGMQLISEMLDDTSHSL